MNVTYTQSISFDGNYTITSNDDVEIIYTIS
jgi:hypothetical protein